MIINIPEITHLENRIKSLETQITKLEKSPAKEKFWYTANEAAEYLNVSRKTIYSLLNRGLLKTSGGIRHKRIPTDNLERYKRETLL